MYLKRSVTQTDSDKKYIEKMKLILSNLKNKEKNLKVELKNEDNEKKRKNISLMLKVIHKQQKKGEKLMQEREKSSHSPNKYKPIIKYQLSPPIV